MLTTASEHVLIEACFLPDLILACDSHWIRGNIYTSSVYKFLWMFSFVCLIWVAHTLRLLIGLDFISPCRSSVLAIVFLVNLLKISSNYHFIITFSIESGIVQIGFTLRGHMQGTLSNFGSNLCFRSRLTFQRLFWSIFYLDWLW